MFDMDGPPMSFPNPKGPESINPTAVAHAGGGVKMVGKGPRIIGAWPVIAGADMLLVPVNFVSGFVCRFPLVID